MATQAGRNLCLGYSFVQRYSHRIFSIPISRMVPLYKFRKALNPLCLKGSAAFKSDLDMSWSFLSNCGRLFLSVPLAGLSAVPPSTTGTAARSAAAFHLRRPQNKNRVFVNGSSSNCRCTRAASPSIPFRRSVYPTARYTRSAPVKSQAARTAPLPVSPQWPIIAFSCISSPRLDSKG